MKQTKWIAFSLALLMMGVTACLLRRAANEQVLSAPGVKVGSLPNFDDKGHQFSTARVLLPDRLPGWTGCDFPMTAVEVATLPRDTTFGRHLYTNDDFKTEATVVLMGADRASIHRPQWCLEGAGWHIDQDVRDVVPMTRPYRYRLPVNKLFLSRGSLGGVYIYWYVSKDKITAEQLGRLWSSTRTALTTGVRERWAYVSYLAICPPGREEATFRRLQDIIAKSVPEFQMAAGPPESETPPLAADN